MRNFEFQEARFQNGLIMLKKNDDERNVSFVVILTSSWHDVNIPAVCKIFFFWFRPLGWVIKVNSQQFCVLFTCQNDRKCRDYRRKQKRIICRKDEKNMKN